VYVLIAVSGYVARAGIEEEVGLVRQGVNNHVWAAILHAGDLAMLKIFALCSTETVVRVFSQGKVPKRHRCGMRQARSWLVQTFRVDEMKGETESRQPLSLRYDVNPHRDANVRFERQVFHPQTSASFSGAQNAYSPHLSRKQCNFDHLPLSHPDRMEELKANIAQLVDDDESTILFVPSRSCTLE